MKLGPLRGRVRERPPERIVICPRGGVGGDERAIEIGISAAVGVMPIAMAVATCTHEQDARTTVGTGVENLPAVGIRTCP
jgi:hypothetical protein